MVQMQLTNHVIEWERRLEYEAERRLNGRREPYVNFLAAPNLRRAESRPEPERRAPVDFVSALSLYLANL